MHGLEIPCIYHLYRHAPATLSLHAPPPRRRLRVRAHRHAQSRRRMPAMATDPTCAAEEHAPSFKVAPRRNAGSRLRLLPVFKPNLGAPQPDVVMWKHQPNVQPSRTPGQREHDPASAVQEDAVQPDGRSQAKVPSAREIVRRAGPEAQVDVPRHCATGASFLGESQLEAVKKEARLVFGHGRPHGHVFVRVPIPLANLVVHHRQVGCRHRHYRAVVHFSRIDDGRERVGSNAAFRMFSVVRYVVVGGSGQFLF